MAEQNFISTLVELNELEEANKVRFLDFIQKNINFLRQYCIIQQERFSESAADDIARCCLK